MKTKTQALIPDQIKDIVPWTERIAGEFLAEVSEHCAERDLHRETLQRDWFNRPEARELLRASLPVEVGGLGLNSAYWGRVMEHVGRICDDGSFGLCLSLFPAVANMIYASGNDYLIGRYVRGSAIGETLISFAYTENADGLALKSRVRHEDENLIITGEKVMVGGGLLADAFMTYVVDESIDELCVVVLEKNDPGLEIIPLDTMGLRSAGMAKLVMRDVRVPKNRILSKDGGLDHAQRFLNPRRTQLSAAALGRMARTINVCVDHLHRTVRHDQPLSAMASVQFVLGRMRAEYESAKAIIYASLDSIAAAELKGGTDNSTSSAKHASTEAAMSIALSAFRLMGGTAYLSSNPIERYLRDCFGLIPGAGAQDVLQVNLGVQTLFDFH